jgi:hypothetical protein
MVTNCGHGNKRLPIHNQVTTKELLEYYSTCWESISLMGTDSLRFGDESYGTRKGTKKILIVMDVFFSTTLSFFLHNQTNAFVPSDKRYAKSNYSS